MAAKPRLDLRLETRALIPPVLRVVDQGIDDDDSGSSFGNANGKIEKGESIEVIALIQNQGQGDAAAVRVELQSPAGVYYTGKRQFNLGDLGANASRSIEFSFTVSPDYAGAEELVFLLEIIPSRPRFSHSAPLMFVLNQATKRTDAVTAEQVAITGTQRPTIQIERPPALTVDVDTNIPQTDHTKRNAVAIVIGNQTYQYMGNVDYAGRDATVIKDYLTQTLGYDEANIFHVTDITKTTFETLFGTHTDHKGKLYRKVRSGADIFIYYSGHGHSGGPNQPSYFVPVDSEVATIHLAGYPLEVFYQNLQKLSDEKKPGSLTVVIESCFSGYLSAELNSRAKRFVK
jgi:hypothetical protein